MAQTDLDKALQPVRDKVRFTRLCQRTCIACGKTCLHEQGHYEGKIVWVCLSCDTLSVICPDNTIKFWKGG